MSDATRVLQIGPTEVRVFESLEPLADACAAFLAGVLRGLVESRDEASIALAGGSTPRPIYERLARPPLGDALPWDRVTWFFGDERCVPSDDADSNAAMVRRAFSVDGASPRARSAQIVAMNGVADPDDAARAYELALPEPLDVVLLGAGEDGHTASLFPHAMSLHEATRRVIPVVGPKPPPRRLTLTPPAIRAARLRVVVATGAGKADVLARALASDGSDDATPVRLGRAGIWFLDAAAAAKL
ncbi:MAG: 6-phosphogluconolactonase [Polyangiales bacterium]